MPIYEYRCTACDHRFETLVSRASMPECPECRSRDLEKQFSVFAVASGPAASSPAAGPCGTCGDPRGPGACSLT